MQYSKPYLTNYTSFLQFLQELAPRKKSDILTKSKIGLQVIEFGKVGEYETAKQWSNANPIWLGMKAHHGIGRFVFNSTGIHKFSGLKFYFRHNADGKIWYCYFNRSLNENLSQQLFRILLMGL